MAGYTKLFASITDSTIWQAPDTTRLVWVTMLAMSDAGGYVAASVPGLANRARVSIDACLAALEAFRNPDEWSRTKDHEGRRIIDVDGGWMLLNHDKYRAMREVDDRREAARVGMAKLRAKRKDKVLTELPKVNIVGHGLPPLAHADASSNADSKKPNTGRASPAKRSTPPRPDDVLERTWDDWLQLRKSKKAPVTETVLNGAISEAAKAGMSLEDFLQAWCRRGSQGLEAAWLKQGERGQETAYQRSKRELFEAATGRNKPIDITPTTLELS